MHRKYRLIRLNVTEMAIGANAALHGDERYKVVL